MRYFDSDAESILCQWSPLWHITLIGYMLQVIAIDNEYKAVNENAQVPQNCT